MVVYRRTSVTTKVGSRRNAEVVRLEVFQGFLTKCRYLYRLQGRFEGRNVVDSGLVTTRTLR